MRAKPTYHLSPWGGESQPRKADRMSRHSRSTVLGLVVLGLVLVAGPVFAANLFTVNETASTGITGSKLFVPTFISSGDSTGIGGTWTTGGIFIPYLGTMTPCAAAIGTTNTVQGCARWGTASIQAWATGLYFDPRFGTPFIPPSGDHHRTGYRMLMQPSFSGGQWLSGFAPLGPRFPFFPSLGQSGAGGDVGLALANASQESGLNSILELADAHGEPLTTGKFPRYWPHAREAWVDTIVVKYTAGGTGALNFSQNLRSQVGFSREATKVRWRAMNNMDGEFSLDQDGLTTTVNASNGCNGGDWCEFYVTTDGAGNVHLFVVKNADGNTDTPDGTPIEITQSTRLNTKDGIFNGGLVLKNVGLSNLEKLPILIDDRLSQTDDDPSGEPMTLMSQFRVYSGPNVHSEEGKDPYAWVICGTRGANYGEHLCDNVGGAIDAPVVGVNHNEMAIVYNSNFPGLLGDSVLRRYGRDLNPNLSGSASPGGDPNQITALYIACGAGGAGCVSNPGLDGFYGSVDDGTIYYLEAQENGLRGWVRDSNKHTFGFLGADDDGTHNSISPANFGLTQLVEQATEGFLLSCLGCNPHSLPLSPETITYTFDWPGVPPIANPGHGPVGTTVFTVAP